APVERLTPPSSAMISAPLKAIAMPAALRRVIASPRKTAARTATKIGPMLTSRLAVPAGAGPLPPVGGSGDGPLPVAAGGGRARGDQRRQVAGARAAEPEERRDGGEGERRDEQPQDGELDRAEPFERGADGGEGRRPQDDGDEDGETRHASNDRPFVIEAQAK